MQKLKNVELIPGDCNKEISKVSSPPSPSLGVAFVDPTGLSPLLFETIRKLSTKRKIDLIINFHEGMGVRMNLHQYTTTDENALTSFMGSSRWKEHFKEQHKSETCRAIAKEYLENLQKLGYLAFDSDRISALQGRSRALESAGDEIRWLPLLVGTQRRHRKNPKRRNETCSRSRTRHRYR